MAPAIAVELVEHGNPAGIDGGHPMLEDGIDQTLLGSEVIAGCRGIALTRSGTDLAQRNSVDAPLREEPLRDLDHAFPCVDFRSHNEKSYPTWVEKSRAFS